jgi:signal peptidase
MTGLFSYKPVVIMSDSMVPIFARGSIVVVQQRYDPLDIQVGDIIQYSADTIMITHRVVAIEVGDESKRIFITKGDNNSSYDSPVKDNQIVGVVRSTVPYLGYPTVWLQELSR